MNLNLIYCLSSCIMSFNLFMHHIVLFVLYFFCANLQSALGFVFCFFSLFACAFGFYSSTMPRKTRANRVLSSPPVSPSRVQLF